MILKIGVMKMPTKKYEFEKVVYGVYSVCPVCGKRFYQDCPAEWVYKILPITKSASGTKQKVCSWHCQRKGEQMHDDMIAARKEKRIQEAMKKVRCEV